VEGYNLFVEMMAQIRRNVIYSVYQFQPKRAAANPEGVREIEIGTSGTNGGISAGAAEGEFPAVGDGQPEEQMAAAAGAYTRPLSSST